MFSLNLARIDVFFFIFIFFHFSVTTTLFFPIITCYSMLHLGHPFGWGFLDVLTSEWEARLLWAPIDLLRGIQISPLPKLIPIKGLRQPKRFNSPMPQPSHSANGLHVDISLRKRVRCQQQYVSFHTATLNARVRGGWYREKRDSCFFTGLQCCLCLSHKQFILDFLWGEIAKTSTKMEFQMHWLV